MKEAIIKIMTILSWYNGLFIQALLYMFTHQIIISSAQSNGFYSIDCGSNGTTTYNDDSGIIWTPDTMVNDSVVQLGKSLIVGDEDVDINKMIFRRFRYFPDETGKYTKYCYTLRPVQQGDVYIVRAIFYIGYTSGVYSNNTKEVSFKFIIDSYVASDVVVPIPQVNKSLVTKEVYVKATSDKIMACVASGENFPFISSIELRPLSTQEYGANLANSLQRSLVLTTRGYFTNESENIRYPDDKYDRIWNALTTSPLVSTSSTIMISNSSNGVPSNILQESWEPNVGVESYSNIYVEVEDEAEHMYLHVLYFAEINQSVYMEGMRVFDVGINNTGDGSKILTTIDIFKLAGGNFKAYALANHVNASGKWMNTTLTQLATSKYPPIVAGIEIFQLLDFTIPLGTTQNDGNVIESLIMSFSNDLSKYVGDPCLPINYGFPWLSCNTIGNLTHIIGINLSNFGLVGEIPPNLSNLTYLTNLDLSNNKLMGPIPKFLSMLPSLKVLNLENNNFSGLIPSELLLKKGLDFKYLGNPNLVCNSCSTSSPSSDLTPTIIGLIVGAIVILIILIVIFFYYRQQVSSSTHEHDAPLVNAQDINATINKTNTFTYKEIVEATNNFTKNIGHGGSSDVYQGKIANGLDVAIKVLLANDSRGIGITEFKNEAALLTTIYHKKIVQLIGYCIDQKLALVYELMPNGSLFSALFGSNIVLDCIQRLTIVLDVSQALDYLHNQCQKPIIHRDIKSTNILLDNNFSGKIADLGISKDDVGATRLIGSLGYLDPEYAQTLCLSTMVDIYSFGVVLLEVITGRPALTSSLEGNEIALVEWVKPRVQSANLEELVDKKLKYNENAMWSVVDIAIKCTNYNSLERPQNMGEIVTCLSQALQTESKDAYNNFIDSSTNTISLGDFQLYAR